MNLEGVDTFGDTVEEETPADDEQRQTGGFHRLDHHEEAGEQNQRGAYPEP